MVDLITNIIGARALLILAGGLLIIAIVLGVIVEIQSARLETAKAEKQTLNVQLKGVGEQITAQNGAIDQMLANAAQQAKRLKQAEAEAGKVHVVTQERIQYVQLAAIPATCPDAITWGAGHAIEIGKRWEAP